MPYRYATVFEALNDGKPPNDNIEKGDKILELGKQDTHKITYLNSDNGIEQINFRVVDQYDHGQQVGERELLDAAKEWWFSDTDSDHAERHP